VQGTDSTGAVLNPGPVTVTSDTIIVFGTQPTTQPPTQGPTQPPGLPPAITQRYFALVYPADGRVASQTNNVCAEAILDLQPYNLCNYLPQLWRLSLAQNSNTYYTINLGCPNLTLDISSTYIE
jgi:hypothetical protein